ncbi:hypothetical protein Q604_UNBc4C00242G0001, partial [human gut metagenome]
STRVWIPVERDYLREIRVLDTYVKKGGK